MSKRKLTLFCCDCGKDETVAGNTAQEIVNCIDKLGWHDFPDGTEINARCPSCYDKWDDSDLGNPD